MADEVHENFVRSFINYLKKQVESHTLTADAQESCEVAIQCLQAAFDLGEEMNSSSSAVGDNNSGSGGSGGSGSTSNATDQTNKPWDPKDINLFELFEEHYLMKNPNNAQLAETIKNDGNRLMKEGKYSEALIQYNRAILHDPKNPIFYCNRAAAHIRLGDNNQAVIDCKSALVYNLNYSKAYGRLGIAYSNLGKYEEARQAYEKAIELEPDNQDYRNNLERNSRNQTNNFIPQLTDGLNDMLSNPALRQIFGSVDIDLDQLRNMAQNPMAMNVIAQMLSNMQGGANNTGGNTVPTSPIGIGGAVNMPFPNDLLQLFQTLAQRLATGVATGQQPQQSQQSQQQQEQQQQNNENTSNSNNDQQPPPSES